MFFVYFEACQGVLQDVVHLGGVVERGRVAALGPARHALAPAVGEVEVELIAVGEAAVAEGAVELGRPLFRAGVVLEVPLAHDGVAVGADEGDGPFAHALLIDKKDRPHINAYVTGMRAEKQHDKVLTSRCLPS